MEELSSFVGVLHTSQTCIRCSGLCISLPCQPLPCALLASGVLCAVGLVLP